MRAGIVVNVTRADRLRLEAIVADRSAPQKHVWRVKVIVATADGCGTAEIMRRSGADSVIASEHDILDGIAYGLARVSELATEVVSADAELLRRLGE